MLVKQKLGENVELLPQELIGEVYRCVHDAETVRADGVGDVTDVDRVQVLVIGSSFYKNLKETVHIIGQNKCHFQFANFC